MAEIEVWRYQALTIVELCYEEAGKEAEFEEVEKKIHEKFSLLQGKILELIKASLPYKVDYSNLHEAFKELQEEKKNDR